MRAFFAIVLAAGVPISLGVAVACGPPGSFDNITGGPPLSDAASDGEAAAIPLVEDPNVDAPRAIGPLAGSWLNGSRPKLRWTSGTPDAVGARIILCADQACTTALKTWDALGTQFTVPDDLPPGRYFWKLKTLTAKAFGTKESKPWSILVRGGKGEGIPMGSIADTNGDGISDLFLVFDFMSGGTTFHDMLVLLGTSAEDPLALAVTNEKPQFTPRDYEIGISADLEMQVIDIDGDGLGDPIVVDAVPPPNPPGKFTISAYRGVGVFLGPDLLGDPPIIPGLDVFPSFVAPGDLDGDGYGDLVLASRTIPYAVFGTATGLGTFGVLGHVSPTPNADAGELPPPASAISVGGVDVDHDGRTDVAVASYLRNEGLMLLLSNGRAFLTEVPVDVDAGILPAPATAFGFGDVDGDGSNDTAFATTIAGKAAVCILTSDAELKTGKLVCWSPDTVPAGFASTIVAADLEGDGTDEFLVGTAGGGVDVLRLSAPDKIAAEHLAIDYGGTLTVLDPGRPKAAVWAATRADGSSVALFQGKEQKKLIKPADLVGTLPFQIVRFQAGIR